MNRPNASLELFTRSMERCLSAPFFLDRFYARFLRSSDAIAAKFDGVDLQRQTAVLRASLYHVTRAAWGAHDGTQHLDEIAASHSKHGLDIHPGHYAHWLECLIATARETDSRFDDPTEASWRLHVGRAIDVMIARYHVDR